MKFHSRVLYPKAQPSCVCSEYVYEYEYELLKDGTKKLVQKKDPINFYEKIQKARIGTSIPEILARYSNGDLTAIGDVKGGYADFTSAPRSLAEAHSFIKNAEKSFMKLPPEARSRFNNSVDEFLHSFKDDSWRTKLSSYFEKKDPKSKIEEGGKKDE